ncbi:class I SAM-dependent methyltransferase [Rubritalea tangerina]|uniref:Class I SAM-dependent methyltransferase n=2 Tax=Rubritalea tangerina TaxID=430798 RepID=A0ABW4Z8N1_9BACT
MMSYNPPANKPTDAKDHYSVPADRATPSCIDSYFIEQIRRGGPMPFDRWMSLCLYHPQSGYYLNGNQHVGKDGDFFTSVSVGACFGMLLAQRVLNYLEQTEKTAQPLHLIELGANNGQLAKDILDHLLTSAPEVYSQIHYHICEPLEIPRNAQSKTLAAHAHKLTHHDSLAAIKSPFDHAIILSNELIDAFPVKLITHTEQQWAELYVDHTPELGFHFSPHPIQSPEALAFLAQLPPLPNGYTTEFRPGLDAFTANCARLIKQGMVLTIDYGYTHTAYYHPERSTGTLRTYHGHKAGENPLDLPTQQDITAHVDFTQLATSFQKHQLIPTYFNSQSRFLTHHSKAWLAHIEQHPETLPHKLIRQFQTLTHPTMMGQQFMVLECTKNAPPNPELTSTLELNRPDAFPKPANS